MKVVQVCPRYYPDIGGVITHVEALSKHLIELGVDVEVYTTDSSGRLPKENIKDGIKISRFRSYSLNDLYFFAPKLYSALKELKDVDVVHVHNYQDYCVLAAVQAKRKFQKPLVFTPHYHPIGGNKWRTIAKRLYTSMLAKYLFKKSDMIIAVSHYEKRLLTEKFQLDERKIRYVPNGINVEKYSSHVHDVARKDYASEEKTILYVGRLEEYKGVQFLLRAFPKIIATIKNCQLLIAGDGNYKKALISLVDRLKIRNKVYFLGNVTESELIRLYLSSNVLIMPSQYEAFCIVLAEAMACGLPVIATRVGGIPELLGNNRGFLIDYPPEINTLAKMTVYLLSNPSLSMRIGLKARKFVLPKFSWRSVTEDLFEIYNEVCYGVN